ncbi:MAG: hypothetical protein M3Y29_00785 [Chloroflexota bacterium]|nr:hypothetical protein [Chloroflexota bacterium]
MQRMHRAAGILPILILALAACAAPGTGAGGAADETAPATNDDQATASSAAPAASATTDSDDDAAGPERVDIGVLADDPGSFEGEEIAVLARVDEVLVDGLAFLTSPSGTEEGQFPVVVAADAQVDKEIAVGSVLWLEGTTVAFTAEELEAAGADVALDELGAFEGEFVFVANAVSDPLASGGDDEDAADES